MYELPRPVKRDKHGKRTADYMRREWFAQIAEEIFEAHDATNKKSLAEELTDVITVCTSYLAALGFDDKARAELQRAVNAKNERRGYFEE